MSAGSHRLSGLGTVFLTLDCIATVGPAGARKMQFNGLEIDSVYGFPAPIFGQGLAVAATPYQNKVCFGVVADPALFPDLDGFCRALDAALA